MDKKLLLLLCFSSVVCLVVLVCSLFLSEHFNSSTLVHTILVRWKNGDLVVFWQHLLSEMKNNFGDIEMEKEFGDEKI